MFILENKRTCYYILNHEEKMSGQLHRHLSVKSLLEKQISLIENMPTMHSAKKDGCRHVAHKIRRAQEISMEDICEF